MAHFIYKTLGLLIATSTLLSASTEAKIASESFVYTGSSFRLILNDPEHTIGDRLPLFIADLKAAVDDWNRAIPFAAPLDIEVQMIKAGEGRLDGASRSNHEIRPHVLEEGAAYKIRTGDSADENQADVLIRINPKYLDEQIWMDPNPVTRNPVPSSKLDLVSILRHEIGHAIGFHSFRDEKSEPYIGLLDEQTLVKDGQFLFTGPHAQKVFGGPIPFTSTNGSQNYSHYGNAGDDSSLVNGLMSGVTVHYGTRYEIGPLDLAILKDLGLPVR